MGSCIFTGDRAETLEVRRCMGTPASNSHRQVAFVIFHRRCIILTPRTYGAGNRSLTKCSPLEFLSAATWPMHLGNELAHSEGGKQVQIPCRNVFYDGERVHVEYRNEDFSLCASFSGFDC